MATNCSGDDGGTAGGSRRVSARVGLRLLDRGQTGILPIKNTARESALVDRIAAYINRHARCRVRKTHGSAYTSGLADLIGCCYGRFVAIEVKRPGEEPTQLQLQELKAWKQAGGLAMWTDTFGDVVQLMRELKNTTA